ncbi:MAG: metallophosphoesterase [Thermodesulfovibrio sp.]|nr:metallophosphoesterase [Thermodesulfovibrio sp.]MDW7998515.1 metallophosphoesterase [Thermodesulfovibrio sp.]
MSDRNNYESLAIGLSWIGYIWMAFIVLFFFSGLITDFSRLILNVFAKIFGINLLAKIPKNIYFLLPLIFSISLVVYGYFEALNIKVERVIIHTNKINKNIRIIQISDVHIGLIIRESRIKRIAERIKQANPDILISTGDLVDAQIDRLNHIADILREIEVPYGKFAITGNHEFYAGLKKAIAFTEKAGFEVLRDRGIRIEELNLNIVGFDDSESKRYGLELNIDRYLLLKNFSNSGFTLLLKHKPIIDRELIDYFDLQLSGHTHKGQFFPFNIVTNLYYKSLDSGLVKLGGNAYLYISKGTGTWGPPIRIFAPPEITIIELIKI